MTVTHQLNQIWFKVEDDWVEILLLAGLPHEYRPVVMGIESSAVAITRDLIEVKLLHDVKVDNKDKTVNNEAVLYSNEYKSNGPFKCFICNKTHHFSNQCWKPLKIKKVKIKTIRANKNIKSPY